MKKQKKSQKDLSEKTTTKDIITNFLTDRKERDIYDYEIKNFENQLQNDNNFQKDQDLNK